MYSPEVLDHFEHPRNSGAIETADAVVQLENPACGDVLRLMARVTGMHIDEIRFLARGCVASVACGSAITELVQGRTLGEARALNREDLLQLIGGLPAASMHASHLAMDSLSALLKELDRKL